ncbi:MAG: sigma-70 family RNA polymerase sigma factor [Verrucomicrobia bacterium]|nr:sigma-70 family RNA polymerase sigma factor [Verrucomicrobiota bacterium]
MNQASEKVAETRQTLLSRLKNWDDQESWRQFFDTYWRLLHGVALKAGLTEQEAQDAVQETIIAVAKTMPRFQYDPAKCSFKTWLWHLAQKRISDQFRKRPPAAVSARFHAPTATSRTATIERVADPASVDLAAAWEKEWEQNVFDAAVKRVKTKAGIEQYQIFDFYVLRNWPVKKVASALGISAARVYLAKHRVMGLVKREARLLEKQGL